MPAMSGNDTRGGQLKIYFPTEVSPNPLIEHTWVRSYKQVSLILRGSRKLPSPGLETPYITLPLFQCSLCSGTYFHSMKVRSYGFMN